VVTTFSTSNTTSIMDMISVTKVLVAVEHWLKLNHHVYDDTVFVEDFLEQFTSEKEMWKVFNKYSDNAQDILREHCNNNNPRTQSNKKKKTSPSRVRK